MALVAVFRSGPERQTLQIEKLVKEHMEESKQKNMAALFLDDIKKGLSDEQLQQKYNLSGRKFYLYKAAALDWLAKQKTNQAQGSRQISAKQILKDINSGIDDEGLMLKFNLTPRQLQSIFRQIINAGLATPMELSRRLSITKSQVTEAFVEVGKAIRELD
jgi:hypothetical protein